MPNNSLDNGQKENIICQPTRRSDGFLVIKTNALALHFVTFVDFGFVYGCATILWLKNAEVLVGIPSIYRPPSRMSCAVL
jgi:hypothetical protein